MPTTRRILKDICHNLLITKHRASLLIEVLVVIPIVFCVLFLIFETMTLCDALYLKAKQMAVMEGAKETLLAELASGVLPKDLDMGDCGWRVEKIFYQEKLCEIHIVVDGYKESKRSVIIWPLAS